MRLDDDDTKTQNIPDLDVEEVEYFAEGYSSFEELEEEHGGILYDGSKLQKVADCPRKFELDVVRGLQREGPPPDYMVCGSAVHEALDYFYAHEDPGIHTEEEAIALARYRWRESGIEKRPPSERNKDHLDEDHIATVLKKYFDHWRRNRVDIYTPIRGVKMEDLNLDRVLAARFRLTDEGNVIFGESALTMEFDVDGEQLLLSGRPDLPVRNQTGGIYIMDHKTSQGYLSEWWSRKHQTSNKLRGYMAMMMSLLELSRLDGALINGIYCGKRAASDSFGGTLSERFEFEFDPDHIREALRNQLIWQKTIEFYNEQGYWPQACAFGGCARPDICTEEPAKREMKIAGEYEEDQVTGFQDY